MESILHFIQPQQSDGGRYVCVASNILGEDRRELELVVETPLRAFMQPLQQVSRDKSNRAARYGVSTFPQPLQQVRIRFLSESSVVLGRFCFYWILRYVVVKSKANYVFQTINLRQIEELKEI